MKALQPGGYIELAELSVKTFSDDNIIGKNFQKMVELMEEACDKLGRPVVTEEILKARLEDSGFIDVIIQSFKQPFGPWARDETLKKIGAMVLLTAESGTEGYGMALFTRVLGMKAEEALAICQACAKDIKDKNHHSYTP